MDFTRLLHSGASFRSPCKALHGLNLAPKTSFRNQNLKMALDNPIHFSDGTAPQKHVFRRIPRGPSNEFDTCFLRSTCADPGCSSTDRNLLHTEAPAPKTGLATLCATFVSWRCKLVNTILAMSEKRHMCERDCNFISMSLHWLKLPLQGLSQRSNVLLMLLPFLPSSLPARSKIAGLGKCEMSGTIHCCAL